MPPAGFEFTSQQANSRRPRGHWDQVIGCLVRMFLVMDLEGSAGGLCEKYLL